MYLAGIDDGFKLQGRQQPCPDSVLWDGECVGDVWGRDTGESAGLYYNVRMRNSYSSYMDKEKDQVFIETANKKTRKLYLAHVTIQQ